MWEREIGSTGIMVPRIGFGTIKIGRNAGVRYAEPYDLPDDDTIDGLLDVCADGGVNFIDTAAAYGSSEERLGAALARRGDRDQWVLSTKAGETFDGESSFFDFSPEAIMSSVRASLENLRTDRLELVLIHSNGIDEGKFVREGTLDALDQLKAEGVTRAIGASVKTDEGTDVCLGRVDALMIEYSEAVPAMGGAIDRCEGEGTAVLLKKAFASGRLTTSQGPEHALRFAFDRPGVTSVVIGSMKPENMRANIEAAKRVLGVEA
ncbi:MAG: aldo/keto reductase [Planctomycetota bacterium]